MTNKAFIIPVTILLTLGLSISFQNLLAAWVAPSTDPPIQTIEQPLTKSTDIEYKEGGLMLNLAGTGNSQDGEGGLLVASQNVMPYDAEDIDALVRIIQEDAAIAFRVDDESDDPSPFIIDERGYVGVGTTSLDEHNFFTVQSSDLEGTGAGYIDDASFDVDAIVVRDYSPEIEFDVQNSIDPPVDSIYDWEIAAFDDGAGKGLQFALGEWNDADNDVDGGVIDGNRTAMIFEHIGTYPDADNDPDIEFQVGINTYDPEETLDVDGKIRMRDETDSGDSDNTVATKGYVDDNAGGIPASATWHTIVNTANENASWTNNHSFPVFINAEGKSDQAGSGHQACDIKIRIDGSLVARSYTGWENWGKNCFVSAIVPPGSTATFNSDPYNASGSIIARAFY